MNAPAAKPVRFDGSPTWSASPWRSRRSTTVWAAVAIVCMGGLIGFIMRDWLWGTLSGCALVVVTLDAFVPTRYIADETGLSIHGALSSRRVQWRDVRTVATESDGALLSTARRGVTVMLDCPQRGAWLAERVRVGSRSGTRAGGAEAGGPP